jgi:hypothetical protein
MSLEPVFAYAGALGRSNHAVRCRGPVGPVHLVDLYFSYLLTFPTVLLFFSYLQKYFEVLQTYFGVYKSVLHIK